MSGQQVGNWTPLVWCVLPVNVLPKTNSFGGTSSRGVLVLEIDSLAGSISCSFTVDAAFAWMLYDRDDSHAPMSLGDGAWKAVRLGSNWRSIFTGSEGIG
jgi:hypothetical protein